MPKYIDEWNHLRRGALETKAGWAKLHTADKLRNYILSNKGTRKKDKSQADILTKAWIEDK